MTITEERPKATLREIAPCQKELAVEVPLSTVETEIEAVTQQFKRVAQVPGFRVGHAPKDLIERYHGAKVREECLRRLIGRSLEEALAAQRPMDFIGRPRIKDVRFNPKEPLSYVAELEVAPEVPLGPYKKLKLTHPKFQVSEEAVAKVLTYLQEQHAELKPLLEERAAVEGDFLLVDLTEESPGKSPVKRRDVVISLEPKDPEGVLKGLIGMKPSEKRVVKRPGGSVLKVELKQIKVKQVPALDDTLAKSVGDFDSLEVLKERIRQDLKKEAEASQEHQLEAQAAEQLLADWSFDVPPSLVGSQARRLLKERAIELMNQGVAPSEVGERAQVLSEQAKVEALKEVKLFFTLRRIAGAEGISAAPEEVEARIQTLADRLRAPPEKVRQDLESKDLIDEIQWGIIRRKVFDLILKEADVKDSV